MRSRAPGAVLAALIAAATVAVPVEAGAQAGCAPLPSPEDEASIIAMTNATRTTQDATKLRRDDHIGDAARSWSMRMARSGDFEHSTLSWARGRTAGENIAQASTAREAYRAMLDSPPHRRNLLTRAWRFVGIGAARCDGTVFVTMNLMAGPGIRPDPS